MTWLLGGLGVLLLTIVLVDLIWTTMTLNGPGPISRLFHGRWSRWLLGPGGFIRSRGIGRVAGTGVVLAMLLLWMALTWVAWWLIFSSIDGAVVETERGTIAGPADRFYFAGYTLMTLGIGDFRPRGPLWQAASVVAAFDGFALVTLSISYLVPILAAVVEERQLALTIANLGGSADQILVLGWDGGRFDVLTDRLSELEQPILLASQRLLSYPPLLYFRSNDPRASVFCNLLMLEQVLNLLRDGVAPEHRPHPMTVEPLRRAIGELLDVMESYLGRDEAAEPPDPVPLAPLHEAGIPTTARLDYLAKHDAQTDRLGLLAYLAGRRPS